MSATSIVRALLIGDDGSILNCQFNPETLHRSKTAQWRDHPTRGADKQPKHQFVGTGSEQLSAKLLFDSFDKLGSTSAKPVDLSIGTLLGWLTVPPSSQRKSTPQPPSVRFQWGTGISFKGVLNKVDVDYLMFSPDGRPIRAYASIAMTALPDSPLPTNPSSGGISGRTSAQLREGDTLASVAYDQYGDPNLWRAIAMANGIDDPARIGVGTRLLVPPRTEAVTMSAAEPGGEHA